jgi:DNA-binding NarL/FixJ family response regulator
LTKPLFPLQLASRRPLVGGDLTDREREILALLANGSSNVVIAADLFLSVNTVRNYVQSILRKLRAHTRLEAVAVGVREGIVNYPRRP